MERLVKLTPEQVQKVRGIMRRAQHEVVRARDAWQEKVAGLSEQNGAEIRRAREEWQLKSRRAVVKTDDDIRELLTDEQKSRFEAFIRQRRNMFQNRIKSGGPPAAAAPRAAMTRQWCSARASR